MLKKTIKDYWIAYNKNKQIYFLDSISKDHDTTLNMITIFCEFYKTSVYKKIIDTNEIFIKRTTLEDIQQMTSKAPTFSLETTLDNNNKETFKQPYTTIPINCLQIKDKNYESVYWEHFKITK